MWYSLVFALLAPRALLGASLGLGPINEEVFLNQFSQLRFQEEAEQAERSGFSLYSENNKYNPLLLHWKP